MGHITEQNGRYITHGAHYRTEQDRYITHGAHY